MKKQFLFVGLVVCGLKKRFLCFQWTVQGCCAVSGTGLMEGLDWLSIQVQKH